MKPDCKEGYEGYTEDAGTKEEGQEWPAFSTDGAEGKEVGWYACLHVVAFLVILLVINDS